MPPRQHSIDLNQKLVENDDTPTATLEIKPQKEVCFYHFHIKLIMVDNFVRIGGYVREDICKGDRLLSALGLMVRTKGEVLFPGT